MPTTITVAGVDRSEAYTQSELANISLRFAALDGEVGTGGAPIPDPTGGGMPYAGESFQIDDGADRVIDGFVGDLDRERGEAAAGDRHLETYTVGDENAVLHGFRAVAWVRPAETTDDRFLAFLADFVPWVTDTTWVTGDVVKNMKAKTYTTETLFDEVFGEIKDLTGNTAFVEGHRAHLHPPTVGIAGGLAFTDVAADWDFVTTFPIYAPKRSKDQNDLRTDVMVKSPTHTGTASDATAIARHDSAGLKHEALFQIESGDQSDVDDKAAGILADRKAERISYEFDTQPLTAAELVSIPVGCLVSITSAVMGLTASTQRLGGYTAKYRHPDLWDVHVELGFPVRIRVDPPRLAPVAAAVAAMRCCPPWDGIGSPDPGEEVLNELVWTGDGIIVAGVTAFPYTAGTLRVWVAGLNVAGHWTEDDPTTGDFSLDFAPTTGQVVRVNYTGG